MKTLSCIIIGLLTLATIQRNRVWQDPVRLWTDVVSKSPEKARARINLAHAYQEAGRNQEAIAEYQNSILLSLRDGSPDTDRLAAKQFASMNMIALLLTERRLAEAEDLSIRLWNEFPGFGAAGVSLSLFAMMRNQPELALEVIDASFSGHWPLYQTAGQLWFNRAAALQMLGRCPEADASYSRASIEDARLKQAEPCIALVEHLNF